MRPRIFSFIVFICCISGNVFSDESSESLPCPEGDEGFQAGCLVINEAENNPNSRKIRLFYEWYGKFEPEKKVIVILNGGPGGALTQYNNFKSFLNLATNYNILFYDQRGVGRSSVISKENLSNVDLGFYHTKNNIEDIETIRKRIIKQEQIILLGHSYGAHLAYGYAVKYPQHVLKLISLNGATDNLGFLLQSHKRIVALSKVIAQIDEKKFDALFTLVERGKAKWVDGNTIGLSDFQMVLAGEISFYYGQTEGLMKKLEQLMGVNKEQIDIVLSEGVATENTKRSVFRFDFNQHETINEVINKYIVCHDFITMAEINLLDSDEAKAAARQTYPNLCGNMANADDIQVFDIKDKLYLLNMPTLIVGGSHDPLIAPEVQRRDFELIWEHNSQTSLLIMQKTGHPVMVENPKCLESVMQGFLTNALEYGEIECPNSKGR